jgi:hypothetical protein
MKCFRLPVIFSVLAAGHFSGPLGHRLPAASIVTNGGFTGTLSPWLSEGTIFNTGDAAVFADSTSTRLALFQSAPIPTDTIEITVSFDFFNALSPTTPDGTVRDTFFATIYLGRNPFGSALDSAQFDKALPLFDLDAAGVFNAIPGATFGPSSKGVGWTKFQLVRDTQGDLEDPAFLTIAFEFFEQNGTPGDSTAAVDNVEISVVVPEPTSALAAATALGVIVAVRRKRRILQPQLAFEK